MDRQAGGETNREPDVETDIQIDTWVIDYSVSYNGYIFLSIFNVWFCLVIFSVFFCVYNMHCFVRRLCYDSYQKRSNEKDWNITCSFNCAKGVSFYDRKIFAATLTKPVDLGVTQLIRVFDGNCVKYLFVHR